MKFFRNMYQKSKEQKGFTLVEMIVVLVIIAILAAITIPALLKYIDKSKEKQVVIDARTHIWRQRPQQARRMQRI